MVLYWTDIFATVHYARIFIKLHINIIISVNNNKSVFKVEITFNIQEIARNDGRIYGVPRTIGRN